MGEHVITKDGIGNLRGVNQVHLQKSGLEMALFGLVFLESIEQERGRGLNHILRHEDVDNLRGARRLVGKLTQEQRTLTRSMSTRGPDSSLAN